MENKFLEVKKLFSEGKLSVDGRFLTSTDIEKAKFDELFSPDEYSTHDFDNEKEIGTVDVEEIDFICEDYHDLLESVLFSEINSYPSEVIILDSKVLFVEVEQFVSNLRGWLKFFQNTADHFFSNDREERSWSYVFIDHKSKKSSTVVTFDSSNISSSQIEDLVSTITNPFKLLGSLSNDDAHKGEKLSTMRVSIIQLAKENDLSFIDFLEFGEELINTFHINYETYLRSFSFEDFVKDLEDDVGNFINKVEEQIQGFYLQALAVPGAVILASALRGAEKSISLALIFSASLALILVFRSLLSKKKFINRISNNTQEKLELYQRRTSDIENNFAKIAISEKIDSAVSSVIKTEEDSIKDIENLRDIIVSVIALYFVCSIVFYKF